MKTRKRTWTSGGKKKTAYVMDYTCPITGERIQEVIKGVKTKDKADQAASEIYEAKCAAARRGVSKVATKSENNLTLDAFLKHDLNRPIKASTRALESHRHKPLVDYFEGLRIVSSITSADLKAYQSNRPTRPGKKPPANSTINDELAILRAAMNRAKAEGRLWHVPDFPKRLPEKQPRHRFLTPPQIERLFHALREISPRTADQAEVMYRLGGLRPVELWAMRWTDVDLERNTVTIESFKYGVSAERTHRVLPLTTDVQEIIKRQPRRASGLIFGIHPTERKGHAPASKKPAYRRGHKDGVEWLNDYEYAENIRKAAIAAGLPNPETVTPYCIRHSAATNAEGTDVADIAYMLGHRDANMTLKLYRHARQDRVATGISSLSAHTPRNKIATSEPEE